MRKELCGDERRLPWYVHVRHGTPCRSTPEEMFM